MKLGGSLGKLQQNLKKKSLYFGLFIQYKFPESIPNFFQNCREVGILMEGEVEDIPRSVKDSTKDFRLEGLDACDI
jgi:hypothetical protein